LNIDTNMSEMAGGKTRIRIIQLSAAVGGGRGTSQEEAELRSLLLKHPELEHDSEVVIRETKSFKDWEFLESCLRILLGRPSPKEIQEFLGACKKDMKRWREYCQIRFFLRELSKARKQFARLSESEKEPTPEALDSIWQRFQAKKDKGPRSRRIR
jgi:hypothetical protein